ncbi:hypothetical protein [Kitasatospora kifunensis]|uniref:Fructose-specific phosphotransferase system IIC component n=1 Tax=Kitasatospora kifunensis TaxID=58351 RepID=A0A7W7QWK8_KITKI|nr:hypothetical protein [Kitasatospora kifunensis]MBB4921065.1 fructose-specific phosphotransferase system IIC component [Kitasatospora kifunensis]
MEKSAKKPLGVVSFVLIVGGVSGLLHEWLGWLRLFGFMRFLVPSGYEFLGYGLMIALGVVVGLVSASGRRTR